MCISSCISSLLSHPFFFPELSYYFFLQFTPFTPPSHFFLPFAPYIFSFFSFCLSHGHTISSFSFSPISHLFSPPYPHSTPPPLNSALQPECQQNTAKAKDKISFQFKQPTCVCYSQHFRHPSEAILRLRGQRKWSYKADSTRVQNWLHWIVRLIPPKSRD